MIGYTTKAQRDADIARLEREIAEAQAALADAKAAKVEPDPLLVEAREICATWAESETRWVSVDAPRKYRNAEWDDASHMTIALAALHRGMELAPALGNAPAVPWPGEVLVDDWAMRCDDNNATGYHAALEMARRLREWQQANAAPVPTEAEDLEMAAKVAREVCAKKGYTYGIAGRTLCLAAMLAERRRAQGGAK